MDGDVSRTSPVGSDQEYTRRRFLKTAAWGAAAISAAGIAGCANGGEEQGKAGEAKKNAQGDHQGVGGTSVSEARAAIVLSSNPLYDGFGQRGLFHAYYGGADFGEVTTTAGRIGDSTSAEDWYREWVATADRVAGIGDESAAAGHRLKGLVGELFAFAYRRGAGKHQVDGLCALFYHPYLNALGQLRPQLLLHGSLGVIKEPLAKVLVLKAPLYKSALILGAGAPTC
jgi:hypothetical protein